MSLSLRGAQRRSNLVVTHCGLCIATGLLRRYARNDKYCYTKPEYSLNPASTGSGSTGPANLITFIEAGAPGSLFIFSLILKVFMRSLRLVFLLFCEKKANEVLKGRQVANIQTVIQPSEAENFATRINKIGHCASPIVKVIVLLIMSFVSNGLSAQPIFKPFPQHVIYSIGTIKPTNISQAQMDRAVSTFYLQWKKRFVKNTIGRNESFIWFEGVGKKQCVSEGQGYGMIITALMAGFDKDAQITYDNLYRYYHAHPSLRSKYLMAWAQYAGGKDVDKTSAADGDLDIAYSLLLANRQWGSKGSINYLKEARAMIAAIMLLEINHKTWSVLMSDGIEEESKDFFDTRSSDFMPSHFKAFAIATGDERWKKVTDAGYRLFSYMQQEYSPDAGLIPDFIIHVNKNPKPAQANYLESKYDGAYNYNACRVPWRISVDYLLNGDERSKAMVAKINHWVKETTSNNTYNLSAGYTLAGNDIKRRYFEALSFIAPFGVSAMVDQKNQTWLNNLWTYLVGFKLKDYDYYDNSIKLLDMLIISGNYWKP